MAITFTYPQIAVQLSGGATLAEQQVQSETLADIETIAGNTVVGLQTLNAKDFATQTTLAAILAKIIANAATEAKQDVSNASLASILAKLIVAPATEAKQDDEIFALGLALDGLSALLTELQLKADLTETQPVSLTSVPLPTGAATQTTLAALLTELQLKADLSETQPVSAASLPLPTGAATQTTLAALLTELQLKADLTETQPVQPVRSPTATLANVSSSASNVTLQASNSARKGFTIHNDSTSVLYLKFGATATATSYTVKLTADAYYEMPQPCYTGIIDGIWASANGSARVTEW